MGLPAAGPDMNAFRGIRSGDIRQIRHQYPIPKQIVNSLKENRGKEIRTSPVIPCPHKYPGILKYSPSSPSGNEIMLRKPALVASYIVIIRGYATPYKSEDGYQEKEEKCG
jgi:hypothetical protein